MRQYVKPWVEHERVHLGRQPSGVDRYRRNVEMFLEYLKGNDIPLEAEKIGRPDIDGFMKWLYFEKKNLKNSSRANKLIAVRSFFKFLIYAGVIKKNPTEGIPSPRVQTRFPQQFSKEELAYIFSKPNMTTEAGRRDKALLNTIYGAGLRVSEVCNLTMRDVVDRGSGYIRVDIIGKGDKNRTNTLRTVPSRILREWLTIRVAQGAKLDDPVFIRLKGPISHFVQGEALSNVSINNILKKYAKQVGIISSDAFVHKLRATAAIRLYDSGDEKCPRCGFHIQQIDIYEIKNWLGHESLSTVESYIKISERRQKKTAIPDRHWHELEDIANKVKTDSGGS